MTSNNNEHRKHERYQVRGMGGKVLFTTDLSILNISVDGMAIETSQRLFIDQQYTIKLKFNNTNLSLKGKVMWCHLSRSKQTASGDFVPVYRAGIRFHDILNENAEGLLKFIETKKMGSLENRIVGMRFKVSRPDEAFIDMQCDCSIEKLSLSGMLVATDSPPEIDSQHDMELSLDDDVISVRGRIANYIEKHEDDTLRYHVGIEFISMSDDDSGRLKAFLDGLSQTP